jgi:alkylation response protein AidB-like acyl-CoA dehydrogenase
MSFELAPRTAEGRKFVDAANSLIPLLRKTADQADREAEMSRASFDALIESGITAAFVPEALGGFGLSSVHDWLVGLATLARGDGSTAIAINMHFGVSRGMAQAYAAAEQRGRSSDAAAAPLQAIADGNMLICATATERGTDNLHPHTTATRTDEGWLINGHKMFVTMSPLATHLAMNLRMQDEDGDHLATTLLPIDVQGILPQNDWDALGMRGSGSQSIKLENVAVGASAVRKLGPWGRWSTDTLINRTLGNLALVAAFFGIAQHAREIALDAARTQQKLGEPVAESPGVQHTAGELEIEFTRCRCVLQQIGSDVDDWLEAARTEPPTIESAHRLMQAYQAAKWTVNRGSIDIVSKAMDLAGGGGYLSSNPLTRLYRDVRAGPFMPPHAATDIRRYVGQVALERYPVA